MCKEGFGDVVICGKNCRNPTFFWVTASHTTAVTSSEEQESDAISFGSCPYVYYSNIAHHRYIALPGNESELNNVFCAPLNRRGLLCKDCIDGFGPSIINIGYACANCTENKNGWMPYILSEFVPATVFYIAVLIFDFSYIIIVCLC